MKNCLVIGGAWTNQLPDMKARKQNWLEIMGDIRATFPASGKYLEAEELIKIYWCNPPLRCIQASSQWETCVCKQPRLRAWTRFAKTKSFLKNKLRLLLFGSHVYIRLWMNSMKLNVAQSCTDKILLTYDCYFLHRPRHERGGANKCQSLDKWL